MLDYFEIFTYENFVNVISTLPDIQLEIKLFLSAMLEKGVIVAASLTEMSEK